MLTKLAFWASRTTIGKKLRAAYNRRRKYGPLYLCKPRTILEGIRPDDVLVASYPRSGNTWTRFLLANMLHPECTISFRNLDEFVADLHKMPPDYLQREERASLLKTHDADVSKFSNVVYVVRDGRDVMLSFYHYGTTRGFFWKGWSFSDFIHYSGQPEAWSQHVTRAADAIDRDPSQVLAVRYEDMRADPLESAMRIARFCGITEDRQAVQTAVDNCDLQRLRNIEREYGAEASGGSMGFFRSGTSGQWQEAFSPEDLDRFMRAASEGMRRMGYLTDSDRADAGSGGRGPGER